MELATASGPYWRMSSSSSAIWRDRERSLSAIDLARQGAIAIGDVAEIGFQRCFRTESVEKREQPVLARDRLAAGRNSASSASNRSAPKVWPRRHENWDSPTEKAGRVHRGPHPVRGVIQQPACGCRGSATFSPLAP